MNTDDINFAYKIRHALNERLEDLPDHVTKRLSLGRQLALQRKKKESALHVAASEYAYAGTGGMFSRSSPWFGKVWLSLSALVLVVGMMAFFHHEEQRQIQESAEIDVAVLTDELPPSAYADSGFKAYLERYGA